MTLQTYVLYTTYITGYNTQCSGHGKGLQLCKCTIVQYVSMDE